jgi:hypothetical protein
VRGSGNPGIIEAAAAALVDFIIGFGSGGTTPRSPNTVEINIGEAYGTSRNGLTFGLLSGSTFDGGGVNSGGSDGRFKTEMVMGGGVQEKLLVPDGTYTVRAAMGVDFGGTLSPAIRILRGSDGAVLHSATGNSAAGAPMDITGVQRVLANWDATNASVSITVTGGQGVLVDGNGSNMWLNHMRWQQTS